MSNETLTALKNLLGPGGFIDQPDAMQPYTTSMRNRWIAQSPLVALPSTTAQVAELVKICCTHRLAIVPQGGNTGLVDGGIPRATQNDEIIVSLSRLNKIRDIDPVGAIVTAEAGVVVQTLADKVAEQGFLFSMSMASNGSAQVGGIISTNAGGTGVLRFGNTRQLVLGLETVLPDGQIISGLKKLVKDNTGYHLADYFIGAEGTLGIITAATLRLHPALRRHFTAVAAVPNAAAALDLLQRFRASCAEYLTAFELMSRSALQLVVKHISDTRFPGSDTAPYYVLIELAASSAQADLAVLFEECAEPALMAGTMQDAVVAENAAQAKQFWYLREHIPESLRRQTGGIHFDISLPLAGIAAFLDEFEPLLKKIAPDIVLMPFGHLGDGNLHYNMYAVPGSSATAFAALKKQIQDIVFSEIMRRQGSISAEHGIGVERKDILREVKSPVELDIMRRIKRALDPDSLMNPGKIFD